MEIKRRIIKRVVAFLLCGFMFLSNAGEANAAAAYPYAFKSMFYSNAILSGGEGVAANCMSLAPLADNGIDIYAYDAVSGRTLLTTVLEGGNKYKIEVGCGASSDPFSKTEVSNGGDELIFKVKEGNKTILTSRMTIEPNAMMSLRTANDELPTIGEKNKHYIWTILGDKFGVDGSFKNVVEASQLYSPYGFTLQFTEVYSVDYEDAENDCEYRIGDLFVEGNHCSWGEGCMEMLYSAPGEESYISLGGGRAFTSPSHFEIRKYNEDCTDYEVIALTDPELGLHYLETGGIIYDCAFIMPEGNVKIYLTSDKSSLDNEDFVKRYMVPAKEATRISQGNLAHVKCPVCEKYFVKEGDKWVEKAESEVFFTDKNKHREYVTKITEATADKDGRIEEKCRDCGKVISTKVINRPYVSVADTAAYKGAKKKVQPTVKVTDINGVVIDKKNYKVTYANNTKVGKATVNVTFTGKNYKGKISKTFTIVDKKNLPNSVTGFKAASKSKAMALSWKSLKSNCTGYEVQYSTNKNFLGKSLVTKKVTKASAKSLSLNKLKSKTTYYVRIRAINKVGKLNAYSAWSKSVKVKIK